MFGECNEAAQPKTSLTKYWIEFNDLALQMRPHRIAYLRLVRQTLHITVCEKVCGQTKNRPAPEEACNPDSCKTLFEKFRKCLQI